MVLQSSITLEEPKRAGCERPQEPGESPSSRPTANLDSSPRARPWSGEGVLKPWMSDRRTVCRDDFGESGSRGVQTQVGGQEKDEVALIAFSARGLNSALISLDLLPRSSSVFWQRRPRLALYILQRNARFTGPSTLGGIPSSLGIRPKPPDLGDLLLGEASASTPAVLSGTRTSEQTLRRSSVTETAQHDA